MMIFAAAKPGTIVVTPPSGTGYFYDLLKKWGASDFTAKTGQLLVARPLEIILIILAAWILGRTVSRVVKRSLAHIGRKAAALTGTERAQNRVETIIQTVSSLTKALIWSIAILMILGAIGINLAPLLAGATVVGAAIGFGAQSIIRDILAGFFLVVENQFDVGDSLTVGDVTGKVEDFHLRVTRLRSADGTVWYVPNGEIRKLGNASMPGKLACVDVAVPPGTDPRAVRASVEEAAASLGSDASVEGLVTSVPRVVGIVDLDSSGTTIRVTARCEPNAVPAVEIALRQAIADRLHDDDVLPDAGT